MRTIKSRKAVFFGVPVLAAFVLLGAGALGASTPAAVGVPTTVSFSARLSQDDAPPNGPLDMTFRIYDKAIGGTELWEEAHSQVSAEAGFVSVQLGSDVPLDATLFDGSARFVEIVIGSTVLDPRVPIASVPYALRAGEAKHATAADTASSATHADAADSALSADSASKLGTLAVSDVQKRVTGTCSPGSFVTSVGADGSVHCDTPAAGSGGGGITSVTPGSGLSGSCNGSTCSLSVDTTSTQKRITGTCTAGQQIRAINADGTVTCDASVSDAQFSSQATARCKWVILGCSTSQCQAVCPAGLHVEGGGCDLAAGSPIAESTPFATSGVFPSAEVNPVTAFDAWNCKTADGSAVQGAYAVCCSN